MLHPQIIFEDSSLLVIDKPSGMVVNRGFAIEGETLQDWVEKKSRIKNQISKFSGTDFANRSGIVHRLDKETSGVLLVAKTPEVFQELQRQFKEREVEKTYMALVHGKVEPNEGTIEAPVGRLPWKRTRFGVWKEGREAVTRYRAIFNFQSASWRTIFNEKFTILELYPETGRTHQIRVHLKYIGHPVVGDILYAGRKTARRDRHWCPRLFLHAKSITFIHPATGKTLAIEAPLPKELEEVLASQCLARLAESKRALRA